MNKVPMTEDDLQAWVDGALPAVRRGEVEEYLASHPEEAERVRASRAQKQALKALFQPVLGSARRSSARRRDEGTRRHRTARWA